MGEVGKKDEFLPVRYNVEALFKFLGNRVDGNYTASLNYKSIELKEKKVRKKEKKKYIPPMNHPWRKASFVSYAAKQKHR